MFYAHFVLSKKGPLAKIWLAAHWDKKLTKAHVFETSIEGSVEAIIQPKAKIALRTSGHLLLGVVRIYSRKAKYLLADCNEAFVKIKMAFRPGIVDLPEENREAAVSAITLPEAFHDFDTAMAELGDLEVPTQFALNQSRPEEITMKEDLGTITLLNDDGFGDMGFDGGLLDDCQLDDSLLFSKEATDFATLAMMAMQENKIKKMTVEEDESAKTEEKMEVDKSADEGINEEDPKPASVAAADDHSALVTGVEGGEDDDYAAPAGCDDDDNYDSNDGGRDSPAGDAELFSDNFGDMSRQDGGGLFEDPIMPTHHDDNDNTDDNNNNNDNDITNNNTDDQDDNNMEMDKDDEFINTFNEVFSPSLPQQPATPSTVNNLLLDPSMPQLDKEAPINLYPLASPMPPPMHEPETFVLKSVEAVSTGYESKKYRKKRKLIVDEQKAIASETMKLQLSDTSDIIATLDLAPPTKKLMLWKETGGVEKLTAQPGRCLVSKRLVKIISANLVLHHITEKSHHHSTTPDNLHRLSNHSEELEVRSKIGADGNPRLVFALKKKPLATPSIDSIPSPPHHPLNHSFNSNALESVMDNPNHNNSNNSSSGGGSVDNNNNNKHNNVHNNQHLDPNNNLSFNDPNNNLNNNPNDNLNNNPNNKLNNNPNNNFNNNPNNVEAIHNGTFDNIQHNNNIQQQQLSDDLKWQEATNKLKDLNTNNNIIDNTNNNIIDNTNNNTDNNPNNNTNDDPTNNINSDPTPEATSENNHLLNNNDCNNNDNKNNDNNNNDNNNNDNTNYENDDDDNGDAYGADDTDTSHNKSAVNEETEEEEEEEEEEEDEEDEPIDASDEKEYEELEERRWNKRSHQMLSTLNKLLSKRDKVGFQATISRCNRKQVASKFYSLLVLKKTQTIEVHQAEPYSDILLTKGALYSFP